MHIIDGQPQQCPLLPSSLLHHNVHAAPAGQSGIEESTDMDDSSSDDDSNELPFLARESVAVPRPSHDQRGARDPGNATARHSKEVMEIPEAVEAVTGVNASYLPVRFCCCHRACSSLVLRCTNNLSTVARLCLP